MAIVKRISSFSEYFSVSKIDTSFVALQSKGMMHQKDYDALAAICLHEQPKFIFEIGTYLGVTSNFFLNILPNCKVVSIAYIGSSNNSKLPKKLIGSAVEHKNRFIQIIGNSHEINPEEFVSNYGVPDMIFIDGDHSYEGVSNDTTLSFSIGAKIICWHDANPRRCFIDVRRFLETDTRFSAIATKDDYIGGIAYLKR